MEFNPNWLAVPAPALENILVLSNLAQFLPLKDLLALRRTCSIWNSNFIPAIRQIHPTFKIGTVYVRGGGCGGGLLIPTKGKDIQEYVELLEKSMIIPFSKLELHELSFQLPSVGVLFGTYGRFITQLKLIPSKVTLGPVEIGRIIFEQTPYLRVLDVKGWWFNEDEMTELERQQYAAIPRGKLPWLKAIKLESYRPGGKNRPELVAQKLLEDILVAGQNLEQINTRSDSCHSLYNIQSLMQQVLTLMEDQKIYLPALNKLKLIDWRFAPDQDPDYTLIESLVRLSNRPTRSLKLGVFNTRYFLKSTFVDQRSTDLLKQFLTSLEPSLQHLKLVYPYDHYEFEPTWQRSLVGPEYAAEIQLEIPIMKTLKRLTIKASKWVIFTIDFPVTFPALEVLRFGDIHSPCRRLDPNYALAQALVKARYEKYLLGTTGAHHGVREVKIDMINYPEAFTQFSETFPNIVKLEITLTSSELLPPLWTTDWPHLQHLFINFHERKAEFHKLSLDEAMTGIPKSKHQALKEELVHGVVRKDLSSFKTARGVSDLKGLRELDINLRDNDGWDNDRLTDLTGFYGFLPLKDTATAAANLRWLTIHESVYAQKRAGGISANCWSALREAFGPTAFINLKIHASKY